MGRKSRCLYLKVPVDSSFGHPWPLLKSRYFCLNSCVDLTFLAITLPFFFFLVPIKLDNITINELGWFFYFWAIASLQQLPLSFCKMIVSSSYFLTIMKGQNIIFSHQALSFSKNSQNLNIFYSNSCVDLTFLAITLFFCVPINITIHELSWFFLLGSKSP